MWSLFFIDERETPASGIQLTIFLNQIGTFGLLIFIFLSSPKGMPIEFLERGDRRERHKVT